MKVDTAFHEAMCVFADKLQGNEIPLSVPTAMQMNYMLIQDSMFRHFLHTIRIQVKSKGQVFTA